jgi:hypothetical protein
MEPIYAEDKAEWHVCGSARDAALGFRVQHRVPMEKTGRKIGRNRKMCKF